MTGAKPSPAGGPPSRSLARKAVAGAMVTIVTGVGSRILGLIGTLLLTRYLAPEVYGEVSAASLVVLTAHFATSLGTGQYIASKPGADRQTVFIATVYFLGAGFLAVGAVYLARDLIVRYVVQAPGLIAYLPGLAVATLIDRLWYIPDRLLIRDMRFNSVSVRNTLSELTYTISSVGLAMMGYGGNAIVAATLLRALVRMLLTIPAVQLGEWLTPSPLSREKTREMLSFGIPLSIGSMAHFGSQRWDNAIMINLFGEGVGGLYTLAWNLADLPASTVGERIGDVLVPSFAKLEPARRKDALIRSLTLLTLIVFPLAVGLGAVAPTILNDTLFTEKWEPAGPLLTVLAALGIARPIGWVVTVYLQVADRTRSIMVLEWFKLLAILGGIALLGHFGGVLWACGGVGFGFGAHALASLWVVKRADGISYLELLQPLLRPLLACAPMVAAVLAVRHGLHGVGHLPRLVRLLSEVTVGAAAFVVSALAIAPATSREFIRLARDAIRRRK